MINSINERRSIRKYQERAVDRELIKELIQEEVVVAKIATTTQLESDFDKIIKGLEKTEKYE